jgi:hypothetical protein
MDVSGFGQTCRTVRPELIKPPSYFFSPMLLLPSPLASPLPIHILFKEDQEDGVS